MQLRTGTVRQLLLSAPRQPPRLFWSGNPNSCTRRVGMHSVREAADGPGEGRTGHYVPRGQGYGQRQNERPAQGPLLTTAASYSIGSPSPVVQGTSLSRLARLVMRWRVLAAGRPRLLCPCESRIYQRQLDVNYYSSSSVDDPLPCTPPWLRCSSSKSSSLDFYSNGFRVGPCGRQTQSRKGRSSFISRTHPIGLARSRSADFAALRAAFPEPARTRMRRGPGPLPRAPRTRAAPS
jgi:hypothetical protein